MITLQPGLFDLIKEADSTNWQCVIEIEALKKAILQPQLPFKSAYEMVATDPELIAETKNFQPFEEAKEKYDEFVESKTLRLKNFFREQKALKIAAVFIGLVLSSFFIKKLVDGVVKKTFDTKKTAVYLPLIPREKVAGKNYQNALVTTIVPPVTKEKEVPPKPARPRDIRKQVKLESNDYTVRYFGGISGLKLTVSNKSRHFVNQVELEINYLKRNGDVIETDTYQIRAMKPHSSQTLSIPPSKKGVKVTCKIMNIYARQYRSFLKEI
jgi:hypothetical protein